MKIEDYGKGVYTLFKGALRAKMKVYNGWKHTGWKSVTINHVMLRATEKGGYYIIKGDFGRRDMIHDFKVDDKSLKSYLNR